jgi:site-specific recombinase XerD
VEGLRLIPGGAAPVGSIPADPVVFQRECVDAFVASWWARGISSVTIDNDIGLLERALTALRRPAWEVTSVDIDRVIGERAVAGRSASTRREYLQIFKGFQQFLQTRKAAEIEAGFAVMVLRLAASMPVPAAQQATKTFRTADCLVRVARAESTLCTALECRSTEADAREWPRSADVAPDG